MHKEGMKYKVRIPVMAKGENDLEPRMYEKDEIFEGNPMNADNPVNLDYIQNSEKQKDLEKADRHKKTKTR